MIILHQPPAAWGIHNISPFCVKLETYLRMAKLEYRTAPADVMKQAPNGRIPYVTLDGEILGDSNLIIQKLRERFGDPLDGRLTREQKAQAHLLKQTVETSTYFAAAWLRWSDEESWVHLQEYFRPLFPRMVGGLILQVMRKDMLRILRTQGIGEHKREDIIAFARADLDAISAFLAEKPFFMGEEPTSVDATMYGFLIHQLWVPWNNAVKQHGLSLGNLDRYCQRMKQRFWS